MTNRFGRSRLPQEEPGVTAGNKNTAEIKQLYDPSAKSFEAGNIEGIHVGLCSGDDLVAHDIVAPHSSIRVKDAYREDYVAFLAHYDGPLHVEYRVFSTAVMWDSFTPSNV